MAIDSEDKRRSAISIHWYPFYPVPIGTIEAPDRAQAAGFYAGAAAIPIIPLPVDVWTVFGAPRVLKVKRDI